MESLVVPQPPGGGEGGRGGREEAGQKRGRDNVLVSQKPNRSRGVINQTAVIYCRICVFMFEDEAPEQTADMKSNCCHE